MGDAHNPEDNIVKPSMKIILYQLAIEYASYYFVDQRTWCVRFVENLMPIVDTVVDRGESYLSKLALLG